VRLDEKESQKNKQTRTTNLSEDEDEGINKLVKLGEVEHNNVEVEPGVPLVALEVAEELIESDAEVDGGHRPDHTDKHDDRKKGQEVVVGEHYLGHVHWFGALEDPRQEDDHEDVPDNRKPSNPRTVKRREGHKLVRINELGKHGVSQVHEQGSQAHKGGEDQAVQKQANNMSFTKSRDVKFPQESKKNSKERRKRRRKRGK